MELPWSTEEIDRACRETLEANGLTDAYMRPVAWRGSEQMGVTAAKATPHLAIACWPWGAYFGDEAIRKGLRLDISPWRRPAPYTAPTDSKASGLYMICTMARQAAEVRGYDDALMFDWRGKVAEATGANVFFFREGALHTPTPDCFLDGITRRTVMSLAERRGVEVVERTIWPEELESFEQCFLTGSAAEVTPSPRWGHGVSRWATSPCSSARTISTSSTAAFPTASGSPRRLRSGLECRGILPGIGGGIITGGRRLCTY
jgi:branched-chain amino acid aminotransferase